MSRGRAGAARAWLSLSPPARGLGLHSGPPLSRSPSLFVGGPTEPARALSLLRRRGGPPAAGRRPTGSAGDAPLESSFWGPFPPRHPLSAVE